MMRRECAASRKAADWTLLREFNSNSLALRSPSQQPPSYSIALRHENPTGQVPVELTLEAAKCSSKTYCTSKVTM